MPDLIRITRTDVEGLTKAIAEKEQALRTAAVTVAAFPLLSRDTPTTIDIVTTAFDDSATSIANVGSVAAAAAPKVKTAADVFAELSEAGSLAERRAAALGSTQEAQLESLRTRAGLLSRALDELLSVPGATAAQIEYVVTRLKAVGDEIERITAPRRAGTPELARANTRQAQATASGRYGDGVAYTLSLIERTEGRFISLDDAVQKLTRSNAFNADTLKAVTERFKGAEQAAAAYRATVAAVASSENRRAQGVQAERIGDGVRYTVAMVERSLGPFRSLDDAVQKLTRSNALTGDTLRLVTERFRVQTEAAEAYRVTLQRLGEAQAGNAQAAAAARDSQRFGDGVLYTIRQLERSQGTFTSAEDAIRKLSQAGLLNAETMAYVDQRFAGATQRAQDLTSATITLQGSLAALTREAGMSAVSERFGDARSQMIFTVRATERARGVFTSVDDALLKLSRDGITVTADVLKYLEDRFKGAARAGQELGGLTLDNIFGLGEPIVIEMQPSLAQERLTKLGDDLTSVAGRFSQDLAKGVVSGDLSSALSSVFEGAGSSFGSYLTAAVGGLGGSLLGGLVGGLFSLFGGLFGGPKRETERDQAQRRSSSAPSVQITANVSQTNTFTTGITDPVTQAALDARTRVVVSEVLEQIGISNVLKGAANA